MSDFIINDGNHMLPTEVRVGMSRNSNVMLTLKSDDCGEEIAILDPGAARAVAEAIYSRAGGLPEPKAPDGYLVRRSDVAQPVMVKVPGGPLSAQPNFYKTMLEARAAAEDWAAKFKRTYTVYAVTEIGSAAPSAPPISWTEKQP